MKIKLKTIYASPKLTADVGSVIDLPEKEAADLIQSKYAVPYIAPAPIKNAKAKKGETATIPTGDSAEQEAQELEVVATDLEEKAEKASYGFRSAAKKTAEAARKAADEAREKADELNAAGKK